MESLGSFPRVLNVLPREKIEGPPRDLLKANPRPQFFSLIMGTYVLNTTKYVLKWPKKN